MTTRHTIASTTLGQVTLVAEDDALSGLYFPHHHPAPARDGFGEEVEPDDDPVLSIAVQELQDYLAGSRRGFDLPIVRHGDDFQERVWSVLDTIPFGTTTTYGDIAEALGDKSLAQRVGQAVGSNPLCVIVPCHRVVGKNGKLTGYAGGLKRKQALLDLEESPETKAAKLF